MNLGCLPWPSGAAKNEETAKDCEQEQKSVFFTAKNGPAVSLILPGPKCTAFSQMTSKTYISTICHFVQEQCGVARSLFQSQSQTLQLNTKHDLLGLQRMLTN